MNNEITAAIRQNQSLFGLQLTDEQISRLAEFYSLIQENNEFLHLVAPCSAEEFGVRHILESLTLLAHLPEDASFADVGPGGGLPSIPCLLVRPDLQAVLIESKQKKAKFLVAAISALGLEARARVINRQFEEIHPPAVDFVTCRALDKFSEKLPRMIRWAKGRPMLLFGGPKIKAELTANNISFEPSLMPQSEQRFLFVCDSVAQTQRIVKIR